MHDELPVYTEGATLPELILEIVDDDDQVVSVASGWTFTEGRIALASNEGATLHAVGGLSGTTGGVLVSPSSADFGQLTATGGRDTRYVVQCTATRTADGKKTKPKAYFIVRRSLPAGP